MNDHSQPDSLLAALVDRAFDTFEETLEAYGYSGPKIFVAVTCEEIPEGETKDATVAAFGYEESKDLITDLAIHLAAVAKAYGMRMVFAPVAQVGHD